MFISQVLFAGVGLAALAAPAAAQEFVIHWSSIDGGGSQVQTGPFGLIGTIGQPDSGRLQGGGFEILGGFVSGVTSTLGCNAVDIAEPFGTLNFFDVVAYVSSYNAGNSAADFAAPFGTLNFFDISAYISVYSTGCP